MLHLLCARQVKCYEEDGLVHCGMMKPGWTTAMMASMQLAQQSLHRIALPLLVMHGARDSLVDPASSELVYNLVSSHDKTFLVYTYNCDFFNITDVV